MGAEPACPGDALRRLRKGRSDVQAGFTLGVEDLLTVTGLGAGHPPAAAAGSASFARRLFGDPSRARSTSASISLALIVVAAIAIAVGAASPDSALVRIPARAQPGWLAGPLEGFGGRITFDQFLLLEVAMGVGYLCLLATGAVLPRRAVLGAIAVVHVALLLAPPLLSSDVFSYIDYARLGALHGVDPYAHGPSAAPRDPAFALAGWKHAATAYGPLFTVASYPLAYLGLPLAVWCLKLVAACASLGCVALVWRIAGQLGRSPARAAAVFGLNPVLLIWAVGGAHNDLLMLMLALLAVSLVIGSREALGGAALVAAAAVKATAGLALPFVLLGARRRGRGAVGAVAAGAAVAGGLVVAMAAAAFPGHALGVLTVLRQEGRLAAFDGVPTALSHAFGLHAVTPTVRHIATAAFLATLAWLVVAVWRRGYDWVAATGWALLALVVASPWLVAWYTVWPLPFAAVSRSRRLLVATLVMEIYFALNHAHLGLLPSGHQGR